MNPGFQVVRRGEATATRWKNGGGVTHELAVWPDGADLSGFDARLSMAEVAADGPFSAFPGIDRTLAVLDGGPMRLSFGGAEVAVTALDVGDGVSIVCAWVVPTDPDDDPDALRQRVIERAGERLATYKRPREVRFVDALPRTANGKVQRKRLAAAVQ